MRKMYRLQRVTILFLPPLNMWFLHAYGEKQTMNAEGIAWSMINSMLERHGRAQPWVRTASSDSYLWNCHVHTKKESKVSIAGNGQPARKSYVGLREIKSECLDQRASRKMGRSAKPMDPERNFCSLELHQETFRWLGSRLCVMWCPL